MEKLTFQDILDARKAIRPYARLTPLEQSFYLGDEDHKFYFKLESLQRARSFKIRGAVNKMLSLTEEERQRGVGAVSSGNHGSSVAYAAQLLGIDKAVIIVPERTPQSKIDKIRYFGAEAKLMGRNYDEAHALGMNYIRENGLTNIDSCHDDIKVYAGQGTVALEILEQEPEIDTIVVPIGGGGIATGVALAAKSINPAIRVYGVQTEACPAMVASYADGVCYEEYPIGPTLCDALVGGVGALSYEMLRSLLDDILVVKEETIRKAAAFLLTEEKYVIEAGSATTLAAVWDYPEKFTGKKTALILTGGNIDGETIRKVLA
ncbi:MAG: threonine/serine dehydratase [Ruminococcaceae bacterium]|nr:threonine/serine dehydratase [Oscillospiraceae bacterium]